MRIFDRLFPKARELEAANSKIAELEVQRDSLTERNDWLSKSCDSLNTRVSKQTAEISDLKGKLREQNDADLMLVSAKIILATLKGEKPSNSDVAYQQSLLAQQQAMGTSISPYAFFGGLGALSGLGNILGS